VKPTNDAICRACLLALVASGCGGGGDLGDDASVMDDASISTDASLSTDASSSIDTGTPPTDASTSTDAIVPEDGASPDLDGGLDSGEPTFSCDACAFGCDASGLACRPPAFSNVSADVVEGATARLVIERGVEAELDTDTGAMGSLRPGGAGIRNGVGFYPGTSTTPSVLTVATLTLEERARLRLRGTRAVVIVASGDVVIDGTIDASAGCRDGAARCAGPGGGTGGYVERMTVVAAGGCGPGLDGRAIGSRTDVGFRYSNCFGGGGGAHGQAGARGAPPGPGGDPGALGGAIDGCGGDSLAPLVGGSGGGAARVGGEGGGGGGAVQIASATRIEIGERGAVLASGAGGAGAGFVNVYPGSRGAYPVGGGGGGGGAGGGILLEAPVVAVSFGAVLVANGGAGGGSSTEGTRVYDGEDGRPDEEPARGGTPGVDCDPSDACGRGGDGGSLVSTPTEGQYGGGGGGAGRIRIRATTVGLSVDAGAIVSPAYSTARLGPA
jgi:hypothetical protein